MAKKKKKSGKAKRGTKAPSPKQALTRASFADLEAELSRRQRVAKSLQRKRMRLLKALDEVDRDLASIGHSDSSGSGTGRRSNSSTALVRRRGPRGPNTKTLLNHLEEVLNGQVLSVSEAAEAVLSNGYHTTSKTFRTIVNQTLLANDVFEKIEHGRYTRRPK